MSDEEATQEQEEAPEAAEGTVGDGEAEDAKPDSRELIRKKNAENKSLRERLREAERKLTEASRPKPDDGDKPDLDEIRRQAREEAAAEALKERVMDKIEAKARKFADSEDAAAILLRSHQVEDFIDGGKVDVAAIVEALDELAGAKPHLLARNGSNGGSFDSGRGKQRDKAQLSRDDLKNMTPQQIEAARKAGKLDRLMGKSK